MKHVIIFVAVSMMCLSVAAQAVVISPADQKPTEVSNVQTSPNPNQPQTQFFPISVKVIPPSDAQDGRNDKKKNKEKTSYDKITAYSTLALAVITAFLAAFTYRLWSVTKNLVDEAKEASKAQSTDMKESLRIAKESADSTKAMVETMKDTAAKELRAYIGITGLEIEKAGVRIKFVNNGATPAYNVLPHAWLSVGIPLTVEDIRKEGTQERMRQNNVAGATVWKGIESQMFINDASAVTLVGFSTFVCGCISYDDAFGSSREVCFQFEMTWNNGWKFAACLGANIAT